MSWENTDKNCLNAWSNLAYVYNLCDPQIIFLSLGVTLCWFLLWLFLIDIGEFAYKCRYHNIKIKCKSLCFEGTSLCNVLVYSLQFVSMILININD